MPKAEKTYTTPQRRKSVTSPTYPAPHEPFKGDALLIALAAAYRAADDTGSLFEEAASTATGPMKTYLSGACDAHYSRRELLAEIILAVPASGLPGVMIQIEALKNLSISPAPAREAYVEQLHDLGCWSIFRTLAALTGRTAADGLNIMVPARDDRVDDPAAHAAAVEAYLGAEEAHRPYPRPGAVA